ncbi:MAG: M18 family aminopeptidase [Erysipelotrichaceae bacterium]
MNINEKLIEFIKNSPTSYHVIANIKNILDQNNFIELKEKDNWDLLIDHNYYVIRNDSSIIAFNIGKEYKFKITATHSDSPTLKLKENSNINSDNHYSTLNVEPYGSAIYSTFLDCPLSIAGRVVTSNLKSKLVNLNYDSLIIPNLSIHMNRDINTGYKYDVQNDLKPLYLNSPNGNIVKDLADYCNIKFNDILGSDLYLYRRDSGRIWGHENEFISSPKLDDLQCAFTSLLAYIDAIPNSSNCNMYICLDNEEIGSNTLQGANSNFTIDVLERINSSLNKSLESYKVACANSFIISCDNAHATHPNHIEVNDPSNHLYPNGGIVIKYNTSKYSSDAYSSAYIKSICLNNNIPFQTFVNNSNIKGGSTLGNILTTKVSIPCVDIGLAQLAMHSSFETAGTKDSEYLYNLLVNYYNK